jgi:glycine/D-amino acid oxidase-like deaminating enzyme
MPMQVVVCGAGIVGASVAYYLAARGVAPALVERDGVACAASGKAGGFLALDWCDGSALGPLARAGFALHASLARELGGCGYRALETLAIAAVAGDVRLSGGAPPPAWVDGSCAAYRRLGDHRSTAQVHPAKLTHALVEAACARGASLRAGTVESVLLAGGPSARVRGVRVDGETLPADVVVLALGPWTGQLAGSVPLPTIHGYKGQSIVLHPRDPVPAQALFVEYHDASGGSHAPEVYPRPDGQVYVSGLADESPLPGRAAEVAPSRTHLADLHRFTGELSSVLRDAEVVTEQACYRPVAGDGLPVIGELPGVVGAFVATGHSCWGILNGPVTGAALAERILDGESRLVDLRAFDPGRPGFV